MDRLIGSETFSAIVLGDDPSRVRDAARAVALAGGRVVTTAAAEEAAAAVEQCALLHTIVVEIGGTAPAAAVALLNAVQPYIDGGEHDLVVALDEIQLDLAATLMRERVQLLCEPGIGERATALVLASERARHLVLHDITREGEATRLAALNAEVARIAEVLARLSKPEARAGALAQGDVADPRRGFEARSEVEVDPAEIRGAIRARRMRDQMLGEALFEDPAWDMLLDLFAAHLERAQVSVSSLCIAAAVAPTTALRWIAKLTDAGLFERQPDPFDRRRAFLVLSPRALDGMKRYVAAVKRAGLGIA